MTERRAFNDREKIAIYIAADGRCQICGIELNRDWHADHITPYSKGGATTIENGQALCPTCNIKKGNTSMHYDRVIASLGNGAPRDWQFKALDQYNSVIESQRDFLLVATPGAGKTFFAGMVIGQWLDAHRVNFVIVVVPTDHLRRQWAKKLRTMGFYFLPNWKNRHGLPPSDVQGVIVTYQQAQTENGIAALSHIVRRRNVGAIFDEIHHAGESLSWGDALRQIFQPCPYRLAESGTPFRSDNNPIPFVNYDVEGRSVSDFEYGYGDALRDDKVVRMVFFPSYEGRMEWVSSDGRELSATFDDFLSEQEMSERLRTAIDPQSEWVESVINESDQKLRELRGNGDPIAAGIYFASDQPAARKIAREIKRHTNCDPTVIISDMEEDSSLEIERFAAGSEPWIVCVRMISEGVDIPRLRVGVYGTNVTTELFFRQAVGRVVRFQEEPDDQSSYFYIPRDPRLVAFAKAMREERDHVLMSELKDKTLHEYDDDLSERIMSQFMPITAKAQRHNTIVLEGEITEAERLRARGILEELGILNNTPDVLAAMIIRAAGDILPVTPQQEIVVEKLDFEYRDRLKRRCYNLVGRVSAITGINHRVINTKWVKEMGGMWAKQATIEDLERKREWLISWLKGL